MLAYAVRRVRMPERVWVSVSIVTHDATCDKRMIVEGVEKRQQTRYVILGGRRAAER